MRYTMSVELMIEIARLTAVEMMGASEGSFSHEECAFVFDIVGRDFIDDGMTSELIDFVYDGEENEELIVELAHAFVLATGTRNGTTTNWVEVSVELGEVLSQFAAVLRDGDQGGPLFR